MRLMSLRRPLPREAVLARAVWSVQHGGVHPLAREGVPLTEGLQAGLVRAGVASVWVEDAISQGITPREPLSSSLRNRASAALAGMLRGVAESSGDARVTPVQLEELEDVVEAIISEVRDSSTVVGAMADLQTVDGETVSHSLNVAVLGLIVAERAMRERGWTDWRGRRHRAPDEQRLVKLGLGLMLHDVGKALIPKQILTKPGPLTDEEMALIRQHPTFGVEILQGADLSPIAKVVVADHHERNDGSGYPLGKLGDALHDHARIAAIVDTYDAAAARRAYHPDRTNQVAWELVGELGGRGVLDPDLVGIFARTVAPYPEGTDVELVDGRRGIVARVDEERLDRPVVRVIHDSEGSPVTPYEVDLRADGTVHVADAVAPRDSAGSDSTDLAHGLVVAA